MVSQVKFCGASVASFNSSVGWNSQESKLDVTVVEDIINGDAFIAPLAGEPKTFVYEGFTFSGLIQSVSKSGSSSGSPIYQIAMVDPRVLLHGVQVILGEYSSSVGGVPNIVNVFGYYESIAFGLSGSNGTGMAWSKIRTALQALIANGNSSNFGGAINYKGYTYGLDLSNLPSITDYFRIGGILTLQDIIQQVCDAGGCDYFVTLVDGYITINTISRISIPDRGIITNFITQTSGAVSKSIGEDMVNDVCGKFLVGGRKKDMYFQYYGTGNDGNENLGADNPIWWYWGEDVNGNLVVADGTGDNHVFSINSSQVLIPGIRDNYPTSIGEMRAAIEGEDIWLAYLWINNYNEFLIDENGSESATLYESNIRYPHSGIKNPHYQKASTLRLNSGVNRQVTKFIQSNSLDDISVREFIELLPGYNMYSSELYDLVKTFAEEHYGKKMMVTLPNIQAAYDTESQKLIFNMTPINGGYIDESLIQTGIVGNIIPPDLNLITNSEDNTFKCYVRFDEIGLLDFSEIPENSIFFSANRQSVFIECSVSEKIEFINLAAASGPRAIVTLPGRVRFRNNSLANTGILEAFIIQIAEYNNANLQKISDRIISSLNSRIGTLSAKVVLPAMAAIPLESNVARYGPWYASGANGAMDFEVDDSLTPWNYGTYINMNLAANAKVTTNIANLQLVESGAIEFPGAPNMSLGEQLLGTGPYVSGIQIDIGANGIKTVYRMETWKPRYGQLNKVVADTLAKFGKIYNMNRRNNQELMRRKK